MGLDREVGHDRERVRVLDDDVGVDSVHVPPADTVLVKHVRRGQRVLGAERRILDEWGVWSERRRDGEDRRELLVFHANEARTFGCRVLRLGDHHRDGIPVVLRFSDSNHGSVLELRPKARHRLGQIGRRHDQADARDLHRSRGVDRDDPCAGAIERDELGLEDVRDPDVGHVLLCACDPADAPDAVGRGANDSSAHRCPPSATERTASVIWT